MLFFVATVRPGKAFSFISLASSLSSATNVEHGMLCWFALSVSKMTTLFHCHQLIPKLTYVISENFECISWKKEDIQS